MANKSTKWQDKCSELETLLREESAKVRYYQKIAKIAGKRNLREINKLSEIINGYRRAEESLRDSEEKYKGIFNESVTAIYLFDAEKNFVDSNQAGLDLLGYSREELLTMSIADVDADPKVVLPAHKQLLSEEKLFNYEHQLKRKDGRIITVLNNSKPLSNAQGNVVGMQSTLIDITKRRQAEETLQKSEDRYRNLFEMLPISIWEEDLSELNIYIDHLLNAGAKDLREFFDNNEEAVLHCTSLIKVTDINKYTLYLYKANSKEEFLAQP